MTLYEPAFPINNKYSYVGYKMFTMLPWRFPNAVAGLKFNTWVVFTIFSSFIDPYKREGTSVQQTPGRMTQIFYMEPSVALRVHQIGLFVFSRIIFLMLIQDISKHKVFHIKNHFSSNIPHFLV